MTEIAQVLVNGLVSGSTYAAVAVGFGLTFSVLRVINLAHPEFFMVAMFVALTVGRWLGTGLLGLIVSVFMVCLVMIVLSLLIEFLVLRPIQKAPVITTLIATSGVAIIIPNAVAKIFGPDSQSFPRFLAFHSFQLAGVRISNFDIITLFVATGGTIVVAMFVKATRWGLATRAVAENRSVASTFGIQVNRVSQLAVTISSLVAGGAGLGVALLLQQISPFLGAIFALKAFVCMLVAGNKRIEGIAFVGFGLGILEALIASFVSSGFRDAIAFAILIMVLFIRPRGIFGSYQ